MAKIIIPFPLRSHTDNQRAVTVDGDTLAAAMDSLFNRHPGLQSINRQPGLLSIFINGRAVERHPEQWQKIAVTADDEITLIIPIAGG